MKRLITLDNLKIGTSCRVIEIKKYVKKSNKDGTYNESYKIMYSKHLKSNCIVTSTIMGIFNFAISDVVETIQEFLEDPETEKEMIQQNNNP